MKMLTILIFILSAAFRYSHGTEEYCVTEVCVEIADMLLSNMDHNADPCHDFYQHACGNWVKRNPLPKGVNIHTQGMQVMERVDKPLIASLLDLTKVFQGPIELGRTMMQACVKETEQSIRESLLQYMIRYGGMPIIHDPNHQKIYDCKDPTKFSTILAASHKLAFKPSNNNLGTSTPFFTVSVRDSSKDNNKTLTVSIANPPVFYQFTEDTWVNRSEAQIIYLPSVVNRTLSTISDSILEKKGQIDDLQYFTKFAKLVYSLMGFGSSRNHTIITLTVKDLKTTVPFLDWNHFFMEMFPENMKDQNISDETMFETTVGDMLSLKIINDFVLNATKNECRAVFNHIYFINIFAMVQTQGSLLQLDSKLYEILNMGHYPYKDKENACYLTMTNGWLDMAFGALYVQEHFNYEGKHQVDEIVTNVRAQMTEIIATSGWLDNQTKMEALHKTKLINQLVAFPEMAAQHNNHLLEQYYANLSLNSNDSLFEMATTLNSWALKKSFQILIDPTTKGSKWAISPSVMNAFYLRASNEIIVTAAILNPPLFYANGPKYINYGGIGVIVGHEITHGFDNNGRLFDKNGEQRNWWQKLAENRFQNRSACLGEVFSNMSTEYLDVMLNGKMTLGENIADAGGLKMAYRAYRKYIKQLGKEEPRLPGLMHVTSDQMLFLSSAQVYCGVYNKAGLMGRIKSDGHAVTKFRVAMMMSHSDHFHQAFQCKHGDAMKPKKKCEVWRRK